MFEQQISILQWILKDYVSLKFTLMAAENSYQINCILKYIKIENYYFKL